MAVSSVHIDWWAGKPRTFDTLPKFNGALARTRRAN
jgi:hypothetical protein